MDYIAIYGRVKMWYLEGKISQVQWEKFCVKCTEQLMIENKDVLERLKNNEIRTDNLQSGRPN